MSRSDLIQIRAWPSNIRFEDAKTRDDKGPRVSRPPTHVFTESGGVWGHTSPRQPVVTSRHVTDVTKSRPAKERPWRDKEIAALKRMFELKLSTRAMAWRLKKFSEQGIRNQLARLGLSIKRRDGTKAGRNPKG